MFLNSIGGAVLNINQKSNLHKIIDECWDHYQDHKNKEYIVERCVPVLYFGDIEKYFSSEIKVVTAASNPSNLEFANADTRAKTTGLSFRRFKECEKIYNNKKISDAEKEIYIKSLADYFESKDAYNWFTCYEPLLNGIGASYSSRGFKVKKDETYRIKQYNSVSVHTDIYSPLPTEKPWSEFCRKFRSDIVRDVSKNGLELWVKLIKLLSPDVILMSYSIKDFEEIKKLLDLKKLNTGIFKIYPKTKDGELRKRRAPVVETYELEIEGRKIKVIYGTKMERPFDAISKNERFELGKEIGGIL
jgi:hypothetical protein